jgi:hypothetical protein
VKWICITENSCMRWRSSSFVTGTTIRSDQWPLEYFPTTGCSLSPTAGIYWTDKIFGHRKEPEEWITFSWKSAIFSCPDAFQSSSHNHIYYYLFQVHLNICASISQVFFPQKFIPSQERTGKEKGDTLRLKKLSYSKLIQNLPITSI